MTIRGILFTGLAWLVPLVGSTVATACPLEQSVYRDAAKRGFTLEFSPPSSDSMVPVAAAELRHAQRGKIFSFEVTQSNGYGTYHLSRTDSPKSSLAIYFFDANLQSIGPDAAALAFVADLGAADHYDTRNKPSVGDAMWRLERCKK